MAQISPPSRIISDLDTSLRGKNAIVAERGATSGPFEKANAAGTTNSYVQKSTPVVQYSVSKKWRKLAETDLNIQAGVNTLTGLIGALFGFAVGDIVSISDASVPGSDVVTDRNITAVDDTAGTVTLDGAVFTTADGDRLYLSGMDFNRCGVSTESFSFNDFNDLNELITSDMDSRIVIAGDVNPDYLLNNNQAVLDRLSPRIICITT